MTLNLLNLLLLLHASFDFITYMTFKSLTDNVNVTLPVVYRRRQALTMANHSFLIIIIVKL